MELRWLVKEGADGPERILQYRIVSTDWPIGSEWTNVPEVALARPRPINTLTLPSIEEDFEDTVPSQNIPTYVEVDTTVDIKKMFALLSKFPRVQGKLERTWGTDRGREYLYGLVVDDRPGRYNSKVQGFPTETYQVIVDLLAIHDKLFPQFKPQDLPWDEIG